MKTPWKYLADLMARRRTHPAQISSRQKFIELEAPRAPLSELKPTSVEAISPSGSVPASDVKSQVEIPHRDDLSGSTIDQTRTPDADVASLPTHEHPEVEAQGSSIGSPDKRQIAATSSEPPFIETVTSLDEDIKILRQQLCVKLQTQNDQLRSMLKRFDRS